MERFLLYLDDLEDAIYALALVGERIRSALKAMTLMTVAAIAQLVVILLAMREPAFGAALASLLTVAVLYRLATTSIGSVPQTG